MKLRYFKPRMNEGRADLDGLGTYLFRLHNGVITDIAQVKDSGQVHHPIGRRTAKAAKIIPAIEALRRQVREGCDHPDTQIINSRSGPDGSRYRRHACARCGARFPTVELRVPDKADVGGLYAGMLRSFTRLDAEQREHVRGLLRLLTGSEGPSPTAGENT